MASIKNVGNAPIGIARGLGHTLRGTGRGLTHAGKSAGRGIGNGMANAARGGFTALGNALGPPGTIVTQGIMHWKTSIYIIAGIIIFLLLLFMSISADDNQNNNQSTTPLQITKEGPTQAQKNQTLNYIITVTYPGTATSLVVSDPIPDGTTYASSSPNATVKNNIITWDSKDFPSLLRNPIIDVTFSFSLIATKNDSYVINYATASLTGGSVIGAVTNADVAANQSTCEGKYKLDNPYDNFGDPQCNYTQQGMDTEIKQLDPANALTWDCIAKHESTYNPNAYLRASTSGKGAYGLFQMNPQGGGNEQYDAGNVNWPLQTSNAINYRNKVINGSWAYWQTYSEYCS